MIDHEKVYRVVRVLAGSGPGESLAGARALVDDLRAGVELAPDIVASVTGLTDAAERAKQVEVKVVDRASWASGAALTVAAMLPGEDAVGTVEGSLVLSAVASKVLGQFDPFSEPQRLYLVAPNVAAFRANHDLDRRDLSLWVAVHELTHAVQFSAAPWLRELVADKAAELVAAEGKDALDTLLEDVTSFMSLLEGHAEYVMNHVPPTRIRSLGRIVDAMAAQRTMVNPVVGFVADRFGLTAKRRQYTEGESFVAGVVDAAGMETFNRVWERPENLPTVAELADPAAWIERL